MKWLIATPFTRQPGDHWLERFVPDSADRPTFECVAAPYAHDRSRSFTGVDGWRDYWRHGAATWHAAMKEPGPTGIVTAFPQLPAVIGMRKRFTGRRLPLVAWTFNLGGLPGGMKRFAAQQAFAAIDRFVVHSRAEVAAYSQWMAVPRERFEFVRLQRATEAIDVEEDEEQPFLLSMGSAHRDYRLLFDAVARLNVRTIVVAGPHAVAGLHVPDQVQVRSGLSAAECNRLVQRARVSVVPIANRHTASGQVTLLDAMMFGRPVIATDCLATEDYATDGVDAMLVPPGNLDALVRVIDAAWSDARLRRRLGAAARRTAIEKFSDEAIGIEFARVLQSAQV